MISLAKFLSTKCKEPVFIEDKYDEHGKWMDGWESKRRRDGGNDWAIIKLGSPGIISEINVDTSFLLEIFLLLLPSKV